MTPRTREVRRERLDASGEARAGGEDALVVEEPLEIRISGDPVAVTMRTPGHDRELVLGFLWAEGILRALDDVGGIAHCGRLGDPGRGNTIEVTPAPGAQLSFEPEGPTRRGTISTSACGVCGRRSIDDLFARVAPVAPPRRPLARETIVRAVRELRDHQPLFARTGGAHAAALHTFDGEHVATYEDVGRHNAVDKLIGARLLAGALPLRDHLLVVSGRTSFEIVQKAVAAGIPAIASVSAASSLAVDLAERAGITLAGFARSEALTLYTGNEHVR